MITDFENLCVYVYAIVDDIWRQIAAQFSRPGPKPECSDSEFIAIILLSESRGWDTETELKDNWQPYRHLFPRFPERSRLNRRRRNLMYAINMIRQLLLLMWDWSQDADCIIDSLPVPVVEFHLAPEASREWAVHGAQFGKVASKKMIFFGYKLHLLITLSGVILDFELVPANVNDPQAGAELLAQHTHRRVLADKGYVSAPIADELYRHNRICLLALRRRNQKQTFPQVLTRLIHRVRQLIESVNNQLTEQFNIERNRAHSFGGLCARLYSKLSAHVMCVYINRLLESRNPLQVKVLAFPNI